MIPMTATQIQARARQERRRRQPQQATTDNWREWLSMRFQSYTTHAPAAHHARAWDWAWALRSGERPAPHVLILARGGAKSTTAELIVTAIATKDGASPVRNYAWYVCDTQDQADDHVSNIAAMLEAIGAGRALGKYGNSKGWRRNRLRCANGFTVDALGLDTARRGAKLDEHRPGLMVFDDLDGELDSQATTAKKITVITKKLLPAGADDLAVLALQNLVLPDGIFAQLADGRAQFLIDREVDGPHPALIGLDYTTEVQADGRIKATITAGEPTWAGQDRERCQQIVNDIGIAAFLAECQHDMGANKLRIYECFDPVVHVWPAFAIPTEWQRYGGLDFGGVHTAAVLLAEEPGTKRLILYKEYLAGDATAAEHVKAIREGEPAAAPYCCGGSGSEEQWRREFRRGGLAVNEPDVSEVEIQIRRVWSVVKAGGLIVLDNCPMAIAYFKNYARVPDATGQATREIASKSSFHVGDALRYIVSRIRS